MNLVLRTDYSLDFPLVPLFPLTLGALQRLDWYATNSETVISAPEIIGSGAFPILRL
jgi:hypothetical protein